MNVSQSRC